MPWAADPGAGARRGGQRGRRHGRHGFGLAVGAGSGASPSHTRQVPHPQLPGPQSWLSFQAPCGHLGMHLHSAWRPRTVNDQDPVTTVWEQDRAHDTQERTYRGECTRTPTPTQESTKTHADTHTLTPHAQEPSSTVVLKGRGDVGSRLGDLHCSCAVSRVSSLGTWVSVSPAPRVLHAERLRPLLFQPQEDRRRGWDTCASRQSLALCYPRKPACLDRGQA